MALRRRLPAELDAPFRAFGDLVRGLEPARRELARVVPTTRLPGIPLPGALLDYEDALADALGRMDGWRHAALVDEWNASRSGLTEASRRARRLREEAPELAGFESLIWAVEHVLQPLESLERAERAFRRLRRR